MGILTQGDYRRMAQLSLDDLALQCEVEVFHGHGPGGQGVNTSDSAVRMRHVPTGIVVVSRESRSQYQNRQLCLRKIREELRRRCAVRKRRVATKPTRASTERRLEGKRQRSSTKKLRGRVRGDDV